MQALMIAILSVLLACSPALAQDWAKEKFEKSPRHLEWVSVKYGNRNVKCFIAYPEVKEKATAVVVIHEIFGLSDWIRKVTDDLAAKGFIAIAPDLLSGSATSGGGTCEFVDTDAVRRAVASLPPGRITGDLNAVSAYVSKLPACNGKVTVAGFCWGGSQSFRFATNNKLLKAAFVFYGAGPDKKEDIARIRCPIYAFYGENDARVNATTDKTVELMKAAGKKYESVVYAGAGHGFMRAGEAPDAIEANKKALDQAWTKLTELLKGI